LNIAAKSATLVAMRKIFPLILLLGFLSEESFARQRGHVRMGAWGGLDMGMQIGPHFTSIEFDCARGSIGQPIPLDKQGHFEVPGSYIQEHGGPERIGVPPDIHPARYTGQVQGKMMSITVTLTDTMQIIGTFTLTHGQYPFVTKCL
jgi:hypothetical protein